MKILIFSDSHGDAASMRQAIKKHRSAEVIFFCGDGHDDINTIRHLFPEKAVYSVKGNCDIFCNVPYLFDIELCGKKIAILHGHMHGVKDGLYTISCFGKSRGYDIVIFGHTHKQLTTVEGDMLLMNPGSIRMGYYSILELDEKTGTVKATEYPDNDFGPVVLRSAVKDNE